jgi:hypothetical protein
MSAGAKRRHTMMVLTDDNAHGPACVGAGMTATAPSVEAGSSRRRLRLTCGAHQIQYAQDAMEIEGMDVSGSAWRASGAANISPRAVLSSPLSLFLSFPVLSFKFLPFFPRIYFGHDN